MSKSIPIRHNHIWANMYIVVGIFCSLIFCFGAIILNQVELFGYIIASIGPIYIGLKMKKSNYALVSLTKIQVFGLFGQLKKEYLTDSKSRFILENNRVFLKKEKKLEKVKMNNWFINQYDWKRAIELFEQNESIKITKHLVED